MCVDLTIKWAFYLGAQLEAGLELGLGYDGKKNQIKPAGQYWDQTRSVVPFLTITYPARVVYADHSEPTPNPYAKIVTAGAKSGSRSLKAGTSIKGSVLGKLQGAIAAIKPATDEDLIKDLDPYFSVKNTRASSYLLELGWLFPAFSMLDDDVVGYSVLVRELDPGNPKTVVKRWKAYVPGSPLPVTEEFYNSAEKLTLASLAPTSSSPNGTLTASNRTVDPSVCAGMQSILVWDAALQRGHCRKPRVNATLSIVPGTFLAGTSRTVDLQNMFNHRLENLKPETPYKITVLAIRINGKALLGGNNWENDLWTFREHQMRAFVARIKWDNNAKSTFSQIMVVPAREATSVPSPCAEGYYRVVNARWDVPCELAERGGGASQQPDARLIVDPPSLSAPFYDYLPAVPKQDIINIPGLLPGLVYKFYVQGLKGVGKEDPDMFFPGKFSAPLRVQMPGLPRGGFVQGNTSLPYQLSEQRLDCGLYNISWPPSSFKFPSASTRVEQLRELQNYDICGDLDLVPASSGFGAAMAALTKEVVLTLTDDLPNSKPIYKRFPIDQSVEYYSVLVNFSSAAVKRVIKRTFVLGAITSAGYNKDEEGSNTLRIIDRPCTAGLNCPVDQLDDIFVECPEVPTALSATLGVLPEFCSGNTIVGEKSAMNIAKMCENTTDPLPAPIYRRRLSTVINARINEEVRQGRMLLADETEFSSEPPPSLPADDSFEITSPLPEEPTLALGADKAPLPEDETEVAEQGAAAYSAGAELYTALPADPAEAEAIQRMQNDKIAASAEFAAAAAPSPLPAGVTVGLSSSSCPPDSKVNVLSLGRTQLPSLCDYPVQGTVQVCGTAHSHAVQLLFNVSKAGMYRFDATASGFPVTLDIRNREECSPRSCTQPIRSAEGEASRKSSLLLVLKGVEELAINIAKEGSGCGSGPVVLEISYETPYDVNVLVAPSLALNDTVLGPEPITKDTTIVFNRIASAFEFAFSRVAGFGRPVEIGIFLEAADYVKNGTSDLWYVPEPIDGAQGSKIHVRSVSGLSTGPLSAQNTRMHCSGLGPAFVISHTSPLVVPMGVMLVNCSRSGSLPPPSNLKPSDAASAISIFGVTNVAIRGVMILGGYNNVTGLGGAVSLRDKASAVFAGCIFSKNQAGMNGGAVAVLEESSANFVGCTFVDNEALDGVGGAVVVGSAASPAGEVSFHGCFFSRNEAFSGGDPQIDPARRYGGALAIVRSNSAVTINGTNFDANTADAGGACTTEISRQVIVNINVVFAAAVWAGSPVRISASQILNSFGDGLHISNTEADIDTVIVHGNVNLITLDAGAGLTCTGSSGKVTAKTSSFKDNGSGKMDNFAIMGAGVAVGDLDASEVPASSAPTDAGTVAFASCVFSGNIAGGVNDPEGALEIGGAKVSFPAESGMGGGLAVFGASSPVRIEQCVFRKNEAFMGGGLFSADSLDIVGEPSGFDENKAGFEWYSDAELIPTQMGGGALVMMTAGRRGGVVRINNSLFHRNTALGAFGGGLAVIGASVKFEGTFFIQNQVQGEGSQGGGLYVQGANVTESSDYVATANTAKGPFKNVFLADEAIAVAGGAGAVSSSGANMKSCYQVCGVKSGRCQFPPKLEEWCNFTGSCDKESCPFVTIGAAAFDQTNFRSLTIDIDIPYTVSTDSGAGTTIPCSAAFTEETVKLLGKGAVCKLTRSAGSGSGRRRVLLGPTGNQLIINLGADFTAGPGATLQMLAAGMPAQYQLSDSAVVQATVPRSVLQSSLQIANSTITSAYVSDQRAFVSVSGSFAGTRAPQGLCSALLLLFTALVASLLAIWM
eukprot:tig00000767_g3962.t1